MSSSRPPRVKNVLAAFEKTIHKNNEVGVSSGMYLTTQLTGNKTFGNVRHSHHSKKSNAATRGRQRRTTSRRTSVGGMSSGTASETLSDNDSLSYGEEFNFDSETTMDLGRIRLSRRSSICKGHNNRGMTSQVSTIDEDMDCVGFTVTYYAGDDTLMHDDNDDSSCISSTSMVSWTGGRMGSVVSRSSTMSRGGGSDHDDNQSVGSAISRASSRIRELPRDVEFDSDDSSTGSDM